MKKIVFPALFFVTVLSLNAQGLRYGVKAGLIVSDVAMANFVNPDVESDFRPKAGLHAGIFLSADLTNQFSLDAELLYANKGTRAVERINLHYASVPFLIRYHLSEQFSVSLGPEFGYLVTARSSLGDISNTWNNKLDFGIDADVVLKFNERMFIGLRYNAGFSSVIDTRTGNTGTGEAIKYQNRTLQLALYVQVGKNMY